MKKISKQTLVAVLMLLAIITACLPAAACELPPGLSPNTCYDSAADQVSPPLTPVSPRVEAALAATAQKILSQDTLSDWEALGLVRAGKALPEGYFEQLEARIKENQGNFRKVTDYERLILVVTALGKDATNVAGFDLLSRIYNNDNMLLQGNNGPIFALIALDSGEYQVPLTAKWNREKLISYLLEQQLSDGGFPLVPGVSGDVDITAMAVQALAPHQADEKVGLAIEQAVSFLASKQSSHGGFVTWGGDNSESVAQVIMALTALGIDPVHDLRFVKDGTSLVDKLLAFEDGPGGFAHIKEEGANRMATEQAFMALVAYDRFCQGLSPFHHLKEECLDYPGPTLGEGGTRCDYSKTADCCSYLVFNCSCCSDRLRLLSRP